MGGCGSREVTTVEGVNDPKKPAKQPGGQRRQRPSCKFRMERLLRMPPYLEARDRVNRECRVPLPRRYDCDWSLREGASLIKHLYLLDQVKTSKALCKVLLQVNAGKVEEACKKKRQ